MGKAKWGGVAAAVAIAVIIVVVLVTRGVFTGDAPPDAGGSSVQTARDQDSGVGVDADMKRESTDSGDTEDAATMAAPDDDPDAGASESESADAGTGSNDSGTTVDGPDSVAVEESGREPDEALQAEAETFVRELTESSGAPVSADGVEGFMGSDRTLSSILPGSDAAETASRDSGPADEPEEEPAAEPDTGTAGAAPDVQADSIQSATAGTPQPEGADAAGADTAQPRSGAAEAGDPTVSDVPETAAGDAPEARVDLPLSEEAPVTIAELLGAEDAVASDAVFYVHTVRPDDDLGIWGIVHDGITGNFAEGVAVHRGETVETYRVDIPPDADQLDADRSSSFLGKIIYEKSLASYVYNYRTDRLGRNPDLIMPGQEIVIVSFTPEELIEIYKYFARDG